MPNLIKLLRKEMMPNLTKLLRKEMMPNLTKVIRKEMVNFIIPFPSTCCNLAFKLFNLKLAKTRFVSHIHFIGRCLHAKVTPVGFRIHFHPSNFGVASVRYFFWVIRLIISRFRVNVAVQNFAGDFLLITKVNTLPNLDLF